MDKFFMAGSEGTGQYVVVAAGHRGRVGYRQLNGETRVRVEPISAGSAAVIADFLSGWKQPDEEHQRFSLVVSGEEDIARAISDGLRAVSAGLAEGVEVNPSAPDWAKALVASQVPAAEDGEARVSASREAVANLAQLTRELAAALKQIADGLC